MVNRIAAARWSSGRRVPEELVENALDAGARSVAVRLAAGGLDLVEVSDDGSGMAPDEMHLALERHATSKLPNDRIESVVSFGFRGEALPSIASVARPTIDSRVGAADGWRVAVDHGAAAGDGPIACPPGTRVRVEGLFDKVPGGASSCAERAPNMPLSRRGAPLTMARPDVAFSSNMTAAGVDRSALRRSGRVGPSRQSDRRAWHRHRPHS